MESSQKRITKTKQPTFVFSFRKTPLWLLSVSTSHRCGDMIDPLAFASEKEAEESLIKHIISRLEEIDFNVNQMSLTTVDWKQLFKLNFPCGGYSITQHQFIFGKDEELQITSRHHVLEIKKTAEDQCQRFLFQTNATAKEYFSFWLCSNTDEEEPVFHDMYPEGYYHIYPIIKE